MCIAILWCGDNMSKKIELTIDKKVIEDVLKDYGEKQTNLASSAARKFLAEKIEEALLLKGIRHDIYWKE